MNLKRKLLDKCPFCHKVVSSISNFLFCPLCGEKLPKEESIKLEEIFVIKYKKSKYLPDTTAVIEILLFDKEAKFNKIVTYRETTEEELLAFLETNSDNFIKISLIGSDGEVCYINKSFSFDSLCIEYEFERDDCDVFAVNVEVKLLQTDLKTSFSTIFQFYIGKPLKYEKNALALCSFTDFLYNLISLFHLLPKLYAYDTIDNDFCPYFLRDVIENTILKFKEEHPEEYATMKLAEEIK